MALELIWPMPLLAVGVFEVLTFWVVMIALLLALLPWVVRWLMTGQLTQKLFVGGPILLLVFSAFITLWASFDLALSWPLLLTLLGSVSLFGTIVNSNISPQRFGLALILLACVVALYFVGQYGYFFYPYEEGWLADWARRTSLWLPNMVMFTPHPNAVAGFLEGVWLLGVVLAWQAKAKRRFWWGLSVVIITYGLFITGSRGAALGMATAISLWLWLLIPSRRWRRVIAGAVIVLVALGAYLIIGLALNTHYVPEARSTLEAVAGRLTLYRNDFYLLGDYFFTGIGLGNTFAMVYSRYQLLIQVPFMHYAHNLYLSVGLSLGVIGLAALAWLIYSFYHFVLKVERIGLPSEALRLFRAAWLGVTIIFGHGLTDSPQFAGSGWTMPMFFALLGLAILNGQIALTATPPQSSATQFYVGPTWKKRLVGLALALVLISTAVWGRPILAAWYANLGAIYQTRAELAPDLDEPAREALAYQAAEHFKQAVQLWPNQTVANRRLGMMAMDKNEFTQAVAYLERAYQGEAQNQATIKALGLAYLWVGRLDQSETLLQQVDDQLEMVEELRNWSNWRASIGQTQLSNYALEMAKRLALGLSEKDRRQKA